jgi:ParB-like chromosome segregation protein Spo0J
MKVELFDIEKLVPYARNPRVTAPAVDKVAASIKEFGFRQPIVVDSEMVIIVGHVRYQAAQKLGLKKVPVHVAEGMTPEQVKAYRIADNRTGEEAQWDNELLGLEIGELENLEFDSALLGFDESELRLLHQDVAASLSDGIESGEDKPIEEADTRATIGAYNFIIPREQYLEWIEELKQDCGFDKENVIAELKRRLGL